ncbi:14439_t:CDS:2, partial [Gigaspora margarita]
MESQFDYHSNTDVVIQVGEEPNIITFFAHSDILRKKSPYFYTALSNTWARREGENIILKKPNISPTVFSVILEYFNTNNVRLNHCNGSIIFDILVAVDELLIENVFVSSIQEQLMHDKSEWLQNNFAIVLHTIFERDACKELFLYCMDKICWNPNIIFKSPEFLDFENILPLTLKNDLITFRESKYLPDSMLPPRNPIISIDSNIILPQQALKIPEWIIQVQKNTFIPSSLQTGCEAIYDDPSFGPCFGKTDLDMRRQFNEKDNCSAKKRCYKHSIINSTKFSVEDYE